MRVRDVLAKDAIPSVDRPSFQPLSGYEGRPRDQLLVVERGDSVRAFPIGYLNYHEIVNAEVGDTPVAATWCPLCGSAVVFDRRVAGRLLTFGVSGKLADDTLVMYDRETGSEWKQSHGRAIAGEHEGRSLRMLPAAMVPTAAAIERWPDAEVLARPTPEQLAGESDGTVYEDDPYADYVASDGFGLAARRDTGGGRSFPLDWLDPKTVVLGVERDGVAVGFADPTVEAAGGVVTHTVGGTELLVLSSDGLHAYENPGGDWRLTDGRLVGQRATYDPLTGRRVAGEQDAPAALRRVEAVRLYAFGWHDNHGPEGFYRP